MFVAGGLQQSITDCISGSGKYEHRQELTLTLTLPLINMRVANVVTQLSAQTAESEHVRQFSSDAMPFYLTHYIL